MEVVSPISHSIDTDTYKKLLKLKKFSGLPAGYTNTEWVKHLYNLTGLTQSEGLAEIKRLGELKVYMSFLDIGIDNTLNSTCETVLEGIEYNTLSPLHEAIFGTETDLIQLQPAAQALSELRQKYPQLITPFTVLYVLLSLTDKITADRLTSITSRFIFLDQPGFAEAMLNPSSTQQSIEIAVKQQKTVPEIIKELYKQHVLEDQAAD
jgi:hypothetical protein